MYSKVEEVLIGYGKTDDENFKCCVYCDDVDENTLLPQLHLIDANYPTEKEHPSMTFCPL